MVYVYVLRIYTRVRENFFFFFRIHGRVCLALLIGSFFFQSGLKIYTHDILTRYSIDIFFSLFPFAFACIRKYQFYRDIGEPFTSKGIHRKQIVQFEYRFEYRTTTRLKSRDAFANSERTTKKKKKKKESTSPLSIFL